MTYPFPTRSVLIWLIVLLSLTRVQLAIAEEAVFTVLSQSDDLEVEVEFSMQQLDALPQVEVVTGNEFIDGEVSFTGPLARVILKLTGDANASAVKLVAANEYNIVVPVEDFREYDVILATRQDGKLFSRRDKGPIWVIYPMSSHSELRDSTYNARLIWQLVRMEVIPD